MLAPVLARLDGIAGVRESRVDASGRYFVLALGPEADDAAVIGDAQSVLRGAARRLDAPAAERQLVARARGDPWFAASEVHALSYVEARIVAARTTASITVGARLSRAAHEAFARLVRTVLFKAVERAHAEGGRDSTNWVFEEWPEIARAVIDGSRAFLDAETHARVADGLVRMHSR